VRVEFTSRDGVVTDTLEDGLKAVHWYADHGYIQIKIYNSMNPAWVKPRDTQSRRPLISNSRFVTQNWSEPETVTPPPDRS